MKKRAHYSCSSACVYVRACVCMCVCVYACMCKSGLTPRSVFERERERECENLYGGRGIRTV